MPCAAVLVCTNGRCATNCADGQTDCAGRCVGTATDNENCGGCGVRCGAGQVCSMGVCALTCASGLLTCAASAGGADAGDDAGDAATGGDASGARYCANGMTDNANCGACGRSCPAGQVCAGRRCVTSFSAGQSACSGAWCDFQSRNGH